MTLRRIPIAIALAFSLVTCAAKKPELRPPPVVARAEALALDDRAAAIESLERYLADTPEADVAPWAMVYAGEQRRLNGDQEKARSWFERAAERYPTHPLKPSAVLGMALVDASRSLSGNTAATLALVPEAGVVSTMNADRYRILARLAYEDGEPTSKVDEHVQKALSYAEADPTVEKRIRSALADLISRPDQGPAPEAEDPSSGVAGVRSALKRKDFAAAISRAEAVQARWPDSAEARNAAALARRAAAGDPTTAGRVGVLLPLSGEYSPPGTAVKEAISLANERDGRPVELVFVDTGGTPEGAVKGLNQLILEKGCMAVLGPLLRPELDAVVPAAQDLEVPLVVLSQHADADQTGGHVFSAFLTVRQQTDALVAHAFDTRGITSFAVLYPKNAYGESARAAFLASVAAKGGKVTKELSYNPDAKDFLDVARQLGNKADRGGELYRLRKAAEARGEDPSKVTVPPSVDFQAVFIPDNARRSSLVASALAYEEFAVGTFRPRHGEQPILLLGLNGWNSPDLAEGGKYMRDALFVDAFMPTDPRVDGFVDAFQREHGRKPMVVQAMAYDAARLVSAATKKAGADRAALERQLAEVRIDGAVARGDHFDADHVLQRELYVLTLGPQGIAPAQAPELAPPDAPAP